MRKKRKATKIRTALAMKLRKSAGRSSGIMAAWGACDKMFGDDLEGEMVRMDLDRTCIKCSSPMGDHRIGGEEFACPEPPRSGLEYKVVELNPQYAEAKLNDLAAAGWELVGIGGRFGEFAYMKRPLR